jgi:serine/threonine-protein kinase
MLMNTPPESDPGVEHLVADIVRGRVADPARVDVAVRSAPAEAKGTALGLAEHLVRAGELTRFQADKLLRGHWRGLTVGPYQLLCPIARGGNGIVYLARSPAGEPVALKVLPPGVAKREPRTLARFQREQELAAGLPPNPHLTRVYASGVVDGVSYLAMEYVPGTTVRQRVTAEGPLPVGLAARVFADAATGLDAAHKAGFVHRDLKPSNLIVSPGGRGTVLDFGFAYRIGETLTEDPAILGGPGYTLGTPDYLPPEQAVNAAKARPASDLYALGCALYFAVTGSPPFPDGTAQEKFRRHRTEIAAPVTDLNPLIPAEFARLIGWAMAKRPADRPKTAGEFARALVPWADPVRPSADADAKPPLAELVKVVETRWLAARAVGRERSAASDSLITEMIGSSVSVAEIDDQSEVRLPTWVVAASAVGFGFGLVAAVAAGWVVGRWSVG